jgi:Outer membrane protein beta-barrel domain
MKKVLLLLLTAAGTLQSIAQNDTTIVNIEKKEDGDTIRVGSMIIIKKGSPGSRTYNVFDDGYHHKTNFYRRNISTNWLILDIGYAGYNDRTNYSSAEAQSFLRDQQGQPAIKGDYAIKGTRISNFNLWFFMQRLNLIKHVVNLKYGFGAEWNNYYYKTPITYVDGASPYTFRDSVGFSKNKLAANYLTVPLMINFSTHPHKRHGGLQVSFGVSAGYLFDAKQKQISDERGKQKNKTDFNLEKWKIAYVGELGLGPVKLYGSYSLTTLHQYGLEQFPYTVGIRLSNW